MYYGIKSWGGISNPWAVIAIIYFISLVVIGNCILSHTQPSYFLALFVTDRFAFVRPWIIFKRHCV